MTDILAVVGILGILGALAWLMWRVVVPQNDADLRAYIETGVLHRRFQRKGPRKEGTP